MGHLLREYGIIALLIAVAMAGYVYYSVNKEDVLAYTLDVIGERLISLVDDDATKESIGRRYADFRDRILENEVDPTEVENLAANVLNLSASGTKLTKDEAEFMLDMDMWSYESGVVDDQTMIDIKVLARPPVPPPPPPKGGYEAEYIELGKKLNMVLQAESELLAMAETGDAAVAPEPYLLFSARDGIHVTIDSAVLAYVDQDEVRSRMRDKERQKVVVWRHDLMKDRKAAREKAWKEMEHVREREEQIIEGRREYVRALRVLKGLEAKGLAYSVDVDSIEAVIAIGMQEAEVEMMKAQNAVQEAIRIQLKEAEMEGAKVSTGVNVNH